MVFKSYKYRLYPNVKQKELINKHIGSTRFVYNLALETKKLAHECGVINKDLKLSDRVWKCKSCNRVNERDLLAANNIKKFALNNLSGQELPLEPVEMSTLVESVKQETGYATYCVQ